MGALLLKYQSSPLYYQCNLDVFRESQIDGKTVLSAKPNPEPGNFAALSLQEALIQGVAYVFRIRFKVKTTSPILNFHLMEPASAGAGAAASVQE